MIVTVKRQKLALLPERAILWQNKKILILSDVHLGKATTFQRQGIPIPEGSTQADLERLLFLYKTYMPESVIIAGDFIHAKLGMTENNIRLVAHYLDHIKCPIHLVVGNHDRVLKKGLPEGWKISIHIEPLLLGPFAFCHEPQSIEKKYVIAGHLHPQVTIGSKTDKLKLPCFVFEKEYCVLPAFSHFTGGFNIKMSRENKVFVTTGQEVVSL